MVHEWVKTPAGIAGKKLFKDNDVKHVKALHEGVKYPCLHCGNQFFLKEEVAKHLNIVHEGVKNMCRHRGKIFH